MRGAVSRSAEENRVENRRVLVVDDESEIRNSYLKILTAHQQQMQSRAVNLFEAEQSEETTQGFEVTAADQGEVAITEAKAALERDEPFAVAFIDMRMPPGIDGLETAKALRKLDRNIYIVFVTAFADRSVNELDAVLGHDTLLLRKPFVSEEIFQLARNLTRTWEKDRQLEASVSKAEMEAAYRGGIAETGAHILHNFGNEVVGLEGQLEKLRGAAGSLPRFAELLLESQQQQEQGETPRVGYGLAGEKLGSFSKGVVSNVQQALDVVQGMKSLLRHQQRMQPEGNPFWISEFDLRDALQSVLAVAEGLSRPYGIHFQFEMSDAIGLVKLPKSPLQQAAINLVTNAVEAVVAATQQRLERLDQSESEQRWVRLVVTPLPATETAMETAPERFELLVEDSGVGFAPELDKSSILASGYTTKEVGGGQGLHSVGNFVGGVAGTILIEDGEAEDGRRQGARIRLQLPVCAVG